MTSQYSRRQILRAGIGLAGIGFLAGCSKQATNGIPAITPLPTATSTPQPTATPTPQPVSMVLTGDIMLGRSLNTQMLASATGSLFPFVETADFLKKFDLRIGNLECVVSHLGAPIPGKPFTFEVDPLGFQRLQQVGFDVLSVANNHSGDYGPAAFADMLRNLPHYGITPMGGGMNASEAHTPVLIERNGTRIAFVAACDIDPYSFVATETQPGHAWLTPQNLSTDIAQARILADFVIVFPHWGIEYTFAADALQQQLAHAAIDAGADLVVGMHPHDIQNNEMYKGKPIIYSLGNFVFDLMFGPESHGNLLTLTIQKNTLLDWKLVPITINTRTGVPSMA